VSETFECPQGHRWELPLTGDSATTSVEVKCPVCGLVGQAKSASDGRGAEGSESETLPPHPLAALQAITDTHFPEAKPASDDPQQTKSKNELSKMPAIPGYEILECLGEGGMGQVYKARHLRLDRIVALKLIHPERLAQPDAIQRFYREARAAARLAHPHLVTVYDVDEIDGIHFLAMEYIEGSDLGRRVKEHGPLPAERACDYIRQAALGLQHIHERGMVHRDIKPSNLFLTSNGALVKVLDLGLARLKQPDASNPTWAELTQTGVVMGTPAFLAPEQARDSRRVDIRSDIYSLGCTFYYLLTGRLPFTGAGMAEIVVQHQLDEPEPIEKIRSDVPAGVASVLRKIMAKRPEDRYQTPAEVAAALAPFCRPALVEPTSPADQPAKSIGEQPSLGISSQTQALPPSATSVGGSSARETLERRLRAPAIGLLVTGILNWIALPIIALVLGFKVPAGPLVLGIGIMFVMSAVIIFGALKMKNVDSHSWAVASAIVAMLIGPGNLLGVPIGIWALAELFRPGVRELFGATERRPFDAKSRPEIPMPSKARVRLVLLGCGLLMLGAIACVGAIALLSLNSGDIGTTAVKRSARGPKSQDYQEAEEHNRRALARNAKEFDVAIADLSEAIELAPDKGEYYANRGRRYILRGQENSDKEDFDRAIKDFTEAIRLTPKMADYWNQRGWAYLNKEDWRKALADIEEAIHLSPSAECYSNRAWAYKLKGDYTAALLDLNKAIQLDLSHAPAFQLRGDVYFKNKEYAKALADYNQAIQFDPTYAVAYMGRGETYLKGAQVLKETFVLDRALADLNRAIMLRPSNAKAYLIRSEIHSNLGDKAKSDADRAEAIRRDPSLAKDKK
jgi:serine/threonine protein kinase/tetratricopeptide (TPR) repeat protein